MKARMLFLTVALCFAGTALGLAQSPQMGTWKLDEAKSKIPAGLAKNSTVIYMELTAPTSKSPPMGPAAMASRRTPSGPASWMAKTIRSPATPPQIRDPTK